MTIYIGNKHWSEVIGIEVYCGRPSILQNKYKIGIDGDRNKVCELFAQDFYQQIKHDTPLRKEVIRIYRLAMTEDITLMCWCIPSRCHCDTIKQFLDKYLEG